MKMKNKAINTLLAGILGISMSLTMASPMTKSAQAAGKAPAKTKITALQSTKTRQLTVRYKKVAKAKKYQIQISTDKKFKKNAQKRTVAAKVKIVTFKKLSVKKYYARVRSYRVSGGKKYYSRWSKVRSIKVKGSDAKSQNTDTKKNNENKNSSTKNNSNKNNNKNNGNAGSNGNNANNSGNNANAGSNSNNTNNSGNNGNSSSPDDIWKDLWEEEERRETYKIEDCTIKAYDVTYNGKSQIPELSVVSITGRKLTKDVDFTVSCTNNVNVGKATAYITGKGKYTGKATTTFQIDKANLYANFETNEVAVGDAFDIKFNVAPACGYDYEVHEVSRMTVQKEVTDEYTTVDDQGRLVAKKSGIISVYVNLKDAANYEETRLLVGAAIICDDTDPVAGFWADSYYGEDHYKIQKVNSTVRKGKADFSVEFYSDTTDKWLDDHMTFTVEDATPKAYRRALLWADPSLSTDAPTLQCANTTEEYWSSGMLGIFSVMQPFWNYGSEDARKQLIERTLTITAGETVRVCKICAYKDGKLYDYVYVATQPYDEQEKDLDLALYASARHQAEKQLWTDDMTNYQKLCTLAGYINQTTHYPGYGCTKKETNPTFWNDFSVDGKELYYNLFDVATLNRVMDLQGGITTCVAADVLYMAATEDLHLKALYDPDTNTVAGGEGVWLASGSASSNPTVFSHISLIYKDADEQRHFIDAQGLLADDACEDHGCLEKVLH